MVIAYGVPTEFHGVVTLDASLALAVRPPFTAPPGIDLFPLIAGLEKSWPNQLPALRTWLSERSGRPILHLVCAENPVRVSPLVGALDGPAGESPPAVLAPADGAIVLHPVETPTFAFQPVSGAQKWRLSLYLAGKRFVLDLDPAKQPPARRDAVRISVPAGRRSRERRAGSERDRDPGPRAGLGRGLLPASSPSRGISRRSTGTAGSSGAPERAPWSDHDAAGPVTDDGGGPSGESRHERARAGALLTGPRVRGTARRSVLRLAPSPASHDRLTTSERGGEVHRRLDAPIGVVVVVVAEAPDDREPDFRR